MAKSDDELLDSAKGGDADALQLLLERHDGRVRDRLDIKPKWRTVVDRDDILQITYLEAFLQIACFKGDADVFGGWLDRIARNNLLDAVKELEGAKRSQPEDPVRVYSTPAISLSLRVGLGRRSFDRRPITHPSVHESWSPSADRGGPAPNRPAH